MSTSRIFSSLNALLGVVQDAFSTTSVVVYDGPQPTIPSDQDFWIVGCDNVLSEGMIQAVTNGTQDWISSGANDPDKQEAFTLLSTYVTWTGDNDFPTLRSNAAANIGLVEAAIRLNIGPDDPDGMLGTHTAPGPLAPTGTCNLSIRDVQIVSDPNGTAMHVVVGIDCWTRI